MNDGADRVRRLRLAGATDSFGLACGWTLFNLLAVSRHGLAATGLLNAAMLGGVALSAPFAARVTRRFDGRRLLRATSAVEAVLRAGTLLLLYLDAPLPLLVALVAVDNVVAWTGYAGMRAEVAAADTTVTAMTGYVAAVVTAEAIGATVAALLPVTADGAVSGGWVSAVAVLYAATLLPTFLVARSSAVAASRARSGPAPAPAANVRLLGAGALIMVGCAGPTLLYVGLAARLHGRESVAGAAIAFAVGSLLAPPAAHALRRAGFSATATWPVWGAGMVVGWALAPWHVSGLWLAQLMSGVSLTAFEGGMDAVLAGGAADGRSTAALARGSATRALGGAAAVRLVPMFAGARALPELAALSTQLCLAACVAAQCGAALATARARASARSSQRADRRHRQAGAVAHPERVGAEVGLHEQRVVPVLRAAGPVGVDLPVQRVLHVLGDEPLDVVGTGRPLADPPAAMVDRGREHRPGRH